MSSTIAADQRVDGPKPTERRESVRQTTYLALKDLILSGQLRPAERLSEQSLSQRLGVSRTPLREALMKLEKEGLVVGQRNVGYTVISFDVPAVRQLLVVREALDVCAAELACVHATEEDFARIRAIIAEMEGMRDGDGNPPSDIARSLDLGLYIHRVIAEAARNRPLIQMTDQIYQQLQLALWLEVQWVDFGDSDLVEHKAIAEAICSRDPAAAAAAARVHVRSSLANMDKVQAILESRRSARSLQSVLPGTRG